MTEVLRVENLYKTYGYKRGYLIKAVDNVSFSVNSGEVVGFLGPNGAGKSTTIKMIVGLATPESGNIYIMGQDIKKDRESAMKHVGGVIENPDLYKEWSAYDNLMYLKSLSVSKEDKSLSFKERLEKRKAEVIDILKVVGLDSRMKDKLGHYSLGMKQRLGIAQAIMDKPSLLILDEPANGLDPAGIKEIRDMLRRCAADLNMGILVSSHQLAEMELMCDRFLIIDKGRIISERNTSDLHNGVQVDGQNRSISVRVDRLKEAKVFLEELLGIEIEVYGDTLKLVTEKDIPYINKQLVLADYNVFGIEADRASLEDEYLKATSSPPKKT